MIIYEYYERIGDGYSQYGAPPSVGLIPPTAGEPAQIPEPSGLPAATGGVALALAARRQTR